MKKYIKLIMQEAIGDTDLCTVRARYDNKTFMLFKKIVEKYVMRAMEIYSQGIVRELIDIVNLSDDEVRLQKYKAYCSQKGWDYELLFRINEINKDQRKELNRTRAKQRAERL